MHDDIHVFDLKSNVNQFWFLFFDCLSTRQVEGNTRHGTHTHEKWNFNEVQSHTQIQSATQSTNIEIKSKHL